MANGRDDARQRGDARPDRGPSPARNAQAALAPPQRTGPFRWIVATLLAISTLALLAIAGLLGLVYVQVRAGDASALKGDIAGVKAETASFHADVTKSLTVLQKGLADTAAEVNSATLELNDIALSLHKKP